MASEAEFAAAHVARLEREHYQAKADAQALADVRTLDEWAKEGSRRCDLRCSGSACVVWLLDDVYGEKISVHVAGTPEAARAKAAAWVREQK